MISKVTIRRFKNLDHVTLPLGRMNVLVGTNNSGKSSVLQGIAFAVSVAQTMKLAGGTNTLSPEQLIYAPLRDVSALALGGDLRQSKDKAIEIALSQDSIDSSGTSNEQVTKVQVRRGKNKNLSVSVTGSSRALIESLDEPFAMYVPGLAGIPASEPYRTPAALRRAAARGDANAVLRNVLWSLRADDEAWNDFSNHLARVFSDHRIAVHFDPNLDEVVDARVETSKGILPIDSAGTGFLQTVQILAYTAKYRPKLLLLDEPDSHIHPDRQRQLITLLAELAEEQDFQVLIATHSRHLLDELVQGAKFHWMSDGKRIEEDKTDRVRMLMDLGALDSGDLLRAGEVDAVVLTEDQDLAGLKVLLEASGMNMDCVQVWSYRGCTQLKAAKLLAQFIRDYAPGTEIVVHRDRDYLLDDEVNALVDDFARDGLRLFVTDGTDIGSHFINVDHVHYCYPELSEALIESIISDATAQTQQYSVGLLAKTLLHAAREERRKENKGGEPDIVKISDEARAEFMSNPARWRHGKRTLRQVVGRLQGRLGQNPKLISVSEALRHDTLVDAVNAVKDFRATLELEQQQQQQPDTYDSDGRSRSDDSLEHNNKELEYL